MTAAVGGSADVRVDVQAVGSGDRERSVEHCHYVFDHADLPRNRFLAVAAGHKRQWPTKLISELDRVTDTAFFDEDAELRQLLADRLAVLS